MQKLVGNGRVSWPVTRLLALPGVFAPLLLTLTVVVATALVPGYSHRYDTISELARPGVAHPRVIEFGFILYGALMLPVGLALFRYLGHRPAHLVLFALIAAYATSVMLAGVFRDGSSWMLYGGFSAGQMHDDLALAGYGSALGILLLTGWVVRDLPGWRPFAWYSLASALAAGGFGLLFQSEHAWGLGGLYQRGFCGTMVLWVGLLSLRLFRSPAGRKLWEFRLRRLDARIRAARTRRRERSQRDSA